MQILKFRDLLMVDLYLECKYCIFIILNFKFYFKLLFFVMRVIISKVIIEKEYIKKNQGFKNLIRKIQQIEVKYFLDLLEVLLIKRLI